MLLWFSRIFIFLASYLINRQVLFKPLFSVCFINIKLNYWLQAEDLPATPRCAKVHTAYKSRSIQFMFWTKWQQGWKSRGTLRTVDILYMAPRKKRCNDEWAGVKVKKTSGRRWDVDSHPAIGSALESSVRGRGGVWDCWVGGCVNVTVPLKMARGYDMSNRIGFSWKAHTICRPDLASRKLKAMIISCLEENYKAWAIFWSRGPLHTQRFTLENVLIWKPRKFDRSRFSHRNLCSVGNNTCRSNVTVESDAWMDVEMKQTRGFLTPSEDVSLTQQNSLQRVKRRNHYAQPYQLCVCII